jgi:hypothetical protein
MKIIPKDWRTFQHYKDRDPSWIKLHKKLLDNYEFSRLPVASKALAPMLWLLASEYEGGVIDATLGKLAYRLRMTEGEVAEALQPLLESDFFSSDSNSLAECKQDAMPEKEEETQVKTETDIRAVAIATRPHDRFEEFWKAYPRRDGANPKAPARKKFFAFVKSGVDPGDIIDGLRGYGAECAAKNQIGTPYVAQAMTWLSQERWNDYRAPPGDDAMTDAKRAELFAKLRGTDAQQGQSSEGRGVHAARAGARENQGPGRQGTAEPPDDPAGDGGVLRVAAVFPRNAGLRAFGDEAGGDGSIEGDDRARGAA